MQRPRITEIHIRIDCNGCVQKIKKALNSVNGIYDFYIDIPQQKLTIIGWADPDRIIKAIKKVRKIATICSHTEAPDPNCQPIQPLPDGGAPPLEEGAPGSGPEMEPQNMEGGPPPGPLPQEPPNYQPPAEGPQPPKNPPDQNPSPETNPPPETQPSQPGNEPRYEEIRMICHHPPNHGYRHDYSNAYGPESSHPGPSCRPEPPHQPVYHQTPPQPDYGPSYRYEPRNQPVYHHPPPLPVYQEPPPPHPVYREPPLQPVYVTHSYNRYRPSRNITEYQYVLSPPPHTTYGRMDNYYVDSYQNGSSSKGNVTSMFSDENPNACIIV